MKKLLKLRAVVSPTPAIIAAAYDENGKADACLHARVLHAVEPQAADAFKCGLVFKKA